MKLIFHAIIILLLSTQSFGQLIYQGDIKDDKHIMFKFNEKKIGKDYIRQILKKNRKTGKFEIVYSYYANSKNDSIVYKGDISTGNKQVAYITDYRYIYIRDSLGQKNVICTFRRDSIYRGDFYSNTNEDFNGLDFIIRHTINGRTIIQIDEKSKVQNIKYTTNGGEESKQIYAIIYDLYKSNNLINKKTLKDVVNSKSENDEIKTNQPIYSAVKVNDTITVISKADNIENKFNQNFLFVNLKTKKVYSKLDISSESPMFGVTVCGKYLYYYKSNKDSLSTVLTVFDIVKNKIILKRKLDFAIVRFEKSKLNPIKGLLLIIDKDTNFAYGNIDNNLIFNKINNINCYGFKFSPTLDKVYCEGDYISEMPNYNQRVEAEITSQQGNFLFVDETRMYSFTPFIFDPKMTTYSIYNSQNGQQLSTLTTPDFNVYWIYKQDNIYWYLSKDNKFYTDTELTVKPKNMYNWADFNSAKAKVINLGY